VRDDLLQLKAPSLRLRLRFASLCWIQMFSFGPGCLCVLGLCCRLEGELRDPNPVQVPELSEEERQAVERRLIAMYCGAIENFDDSVREEFERHFGVETRKAGEAGVRERVPCSHTCTAQRPDLSSPRRLQVTFNKEELFNDGSLKDATTKKDYRRAFNNYVEWCKAKALQYPEFITAERVTMYLLEKEKAGAVRILFLLFLLFLRAYIFKINLPVHALLADLRGAEPRHEGVSVLPAASGNNKHIR